MLNTDLRDAMLPIYGKEHLTNHFNKMVSSVVNYAKWSDGSEKLLDGEYEFDVTSYLNWAAVIDTMNTKFGLYSRQVHPCSVPYVCGSLEDRKELKNIGYKLNEVLKHFVGLVRTDTPILPSTWYDIEHNAIRPGMRRSIPSLNYSKINMKDKEILLANEYLSTFDMGTQFYIEDYVKESQYQMVWVFDGKVANESIDDSVKEFVDTIIANMIKMNVKPMHPQYLEFGIPDYTFELVISYHPEHGLRVFDGGIFVPPEIVEETIKNVKLRNTDS